MGNLIPLDYVIIPTPQYGDLPRVIEMYISLHMYMLICKLEKGGEQIANFWDHRDSKHNAY